MPEPIPRGTPMMLARPSSMIEPTMALAMPPPSSPIGLGICVKNAQFSSPKPRKSTVPRIRKSGTVTTRAASVIEPSASQLESLRRKETVRKGLGKGPRRHSPSDRPDQQASQGIHNEGDNEQDQRHFHQRAQIGISNSFRELVCDNAGQRVSGSKK